MIELFGKSLMRSWSEQMAKFPAAARRKWLAGIIIYGLGVLLELIGEYGHSPIGPHTYAVGLALMLVGVVFLRWGLWPRD